jgi:ribosomal protein L40E
MGRFLRGFSHDFESTSSLKKYANCREHIVLKTRKCRYGRSAHFPPPSKDSAVDTIVAMNENEIPIVAGPRTDYLDVLVSALKEENIPARIVAIQDVDPAERSDWACTPGDEVYVVVPAAKREDALEWTRWLCRVCLECEASLLPKVRVCQKCGTPHSMEPGPHLGRSDNS